MSDQNSDSDRLLVAAALLLPAVGLQVLLFDNPGAWRLLLGLLVVAIVATIAILASP